MDFNEAELLEKTIKSLKNTCLFDQVNDHRELDISGKQIQSIIPHRYPFLLIDQITAVDLEQHVIQGLRLVDPKDLCVLGHFPNKPIYPGVLQIEMMAQLGLC